MTTWRLKFISKRILRIYQKEFVGQGTHFETGQPKVACDVVDMEGYALAKVCHKLGVRLISVKYITDGADDTAHLDWEENLLLGAQSF